MSYFEDLLHQNDTGIFYFETEDFHIDNSYTLEYFIDEYLTDSFEIIHQDGNYIVAYYKLTDIAYELSASGNGDSFNHMVFFGLVSKQHNVYYRNFLRRRKIETLRE